MFENPRISRVENARKDWQPRSQDGRAVKARERVVKT